MRPQLELQLLLQRLEQQQALELEHDDGGDERDEPHKNDAQQCQALL